MKIALIFPGQASQYVGMGKEFYDNYLEAKIVFDSANKILGYDLKKIIFEGPLELLTQTIYTQPAVFVTSVASYEVFNYQLSLPDLRSATTNSQLYFAAGHSLGEYSALYAAGVFDLSTGLNLVNKRAEFIHQASLKNPGTMAAIIGLSEEKLSELCKVASTFESPVEMVNFNSPGQIVISGTINGVNEVINLTKAANAKSILLKVSGAFHSSLMKPASELMLDELNKVTLLDAKIPVVTNCDAQPTSNTSEIKNKLVLQISSPVYWQKSIEYMLASGVDTFIEIGPGRVLSGMIKRISNSVRVMNVEDKKSLEETISNLKG
ncbi:MAG: ACP S-malonyltransferase [Elusimicrobiota bacterium]|nr:ACP S-malonyltransferase [Elusimicrobiota bacterium]